MKGFDTLILLVLSTNVLLWGLHWINFGKAGQLKNSKFKTNREGNSLLEMDKWDSIIFCNSLPVQYDRGSGMTGSSALTPTWLTLLGHLTSVKPKFQYLCLVENCLKTYLRQGFEQKKSYWPGRQPAETCCRPGLHNFLPRPRDGVLFSGDFFVSLSATLRENGWTDLHEIFREGVEWPWDDLIQFGSVWVNGSAGQNLFVITGHSSEDWH